MSILNLVYGDINDIIIDVYNERIFVHIKVSRQIIKSESYYFVDFLRDI